MLEKYQTCFTFKPYLKSIIYWVLSITLGKDAVQTQPVAVYMAEK